MKNFSKKLSFVMATAMVVTSLYAPQGAEAATKNKIVEKNSKSAVKRKNIYIGGQVVDFDAVVKGKVVKDSKGTWKSSDSKIASVDKNGKVKARKNGRVTISFKTKATKKTKSVTVKMTIDARTRASKMTLTPSAVVVKEGEKSTVGVNYEISKKIKAAGGKATTYKLFVESSDEKVAKAYVEGNNKIVVEGVAKSATPVSITVYSAQVYKLENAKKVKYKLTEKFDVKVNGKFDAKQVRANKISVVGTNLSTKAAAYVVKNTNGIVLNLKDNVEVNEAGTVATLESVVGQIPAGLYTVTFEKEDPVEFTAVKQVVEKIVIEPADKLILKGINDPDNKTAYAYYKVIDNFGEDVTEQPLGANIYANGKAVTKKGEVEFTNNSAFILGSTFGLTLVDQNSGKTANATLTVSRESVLSEASFKGLYDKKEKKIVKTLSERADLNDYVLLFEGKDQYGRTHNKADKLQVTIAGATGLQVKTGSAANVKVDGVEYMTVGLSMFTQDKLNAGEATVQAFSLESGKQSTPAKINVVASTEVKTLSIGNGPKTIVAGEEAELSYSAVDADGKAVTDYEVLKRVALTGGKDGKGVRFAKRAGKVVLLYTPAAPTTIDRAQLEYISYVTKTNNVGSATVTVNPVRKPTKISGLDKDTVMSATLGSGLAIKAADILLKDQYGENISLDKLGNKFALKVKFSDNNDAFATAGAINAGGHVVSGATFGAITGVTGVTMDGGALTKDTVVVTGTAVTPGSLSVTLSLIKVTDSTPAQIEDVAGSAYTFNILAVGLSEVKNAMIEDLGLHQASVSGTTRTVKPEVTGVVDGKKVTLVPGKDYEVIAGTDEVPMDTTLEKQDSIGKAKVSVILRGSGQVITKEYEYSKAKPVLTTAELKSGDAGTVTAGAIVTAAAIKNILNLKDQYGNNFSSGVDAEKDIFVTYSNLPDKVVATNNGFTSAEVGKPYTMPGTTGTVGLLSSSDVITIKVVFGNSKVVFEGDVKVK